MITTMKSSAELSPCGQYRYELGRHWGDQDSNAVLVICMLNPSTADATVDDPTITRCIGFAKREGCDGLVVVNLYAWRSPKPALLFKQATRVGMMNDIHLELIAEQQPAILCAWGTKAEPWRAAMVAKLFLDAGCWLGCLGTNKDGSPKHPLYIPASQPIVKWTPP